MKNNLLLAILTLCIKLLLTTWAFAQTPGEYRSRQSGDWNAPGPDGTWEQWNGSAWVTQNQTGITPVSPTVETTNTGSSGNATSHPINLPSGATAGNLLLVVFSADGNPTVSVNTGVSGNNWTKLDQRTQNNVVTGAIFYKIAEGSDVLTLTTSASESSSHISYRISGGTSFNVYFNSAGATPLSVLGFCILSCTVNPPSLSPAPASQPYLWIATGSRDNDAVASSAPANFTGLITQASANGGSTSAAYRNFTGAAQDPGDFGGSSEEEWVSYTLAVYSTTPAFEPISFPQTGFPDVRGINTSSQNTATTSHNVALPSDIVAGDLLLIFWTDEDNNTTITTTGWTQLYNNVVGNRRRAAYYRIATGSEGASAAFTTSGNETSAHNSYCIAAGSYHGIPIAGTPVVGTNQNPDPPTLNPGVGFKSFLWIAASHSAGNASGTVPTNYTNLIAGYTGNTGDNHARTMTARRELAAASEDPGTFGLGNNRNWAANIVAIRGSGTATVLNGHTVITSANTNVPDVTINTGCQVTIGNGVTLTIPTGGTFNVNGTLQMGTDGTATVAGPGAFNLSTGGRLGITNTAGITASGATGSIQTTSRNFNAGANYIYNGNTAQATGNGLPATVSSLTINNGAGVTLSQALAITNSVTFTNGILTTGTANLLSFNAGATSGTSSDASFVHGPVRKVFNNNTESQFVFPVGVTGTGDEPLTVSGVTPGGANYDFTAEYKRVSAKDIGASIVLPVVNISACDHWDLTKNAGKATGIDVTLSWDDNSGCNGVPFVTAPAHLTVARLNGTAWEQAGSGVTSFTANSVTRTNVTSFSSFSLANTVIGENPLPVVFGNVRAYEKNNGVQIDWSNLTEKDVAVYVIERSSNGTDFSAIGHQLPTSNQGDKADYSAFDPSPKSGTNYYRIKAEETTGKIVYSKVLSVSLGLTAQSLRLYPNPVKGSQVNISLSNLRSGQYDLRVVNVSGQDVFKQRIISQGSTMTQAFDLPATVTPGVYNLIITGASYRETKMFIVQ